MDLTWASFLPPFAGAIVGQIIAYRTNHIFFTKRLNEEKESKERQRAVTRINIFNLIRDEIESNTELCQAFLESHKNFGSLATHGRMKILNSQAVWGHLLSYVDGDGPIIIRISELYRHYDQTNRELDTLSARNTARFFPMVSLEIGVGHGRQLLADLPK